MSQKEEKIIFEIMKTTLTLLTVLLLAPLALP